VLQSWYLVSGHAVPLCSGTTLTCGVLLWVPPPHEREHADQSPQVKEQSMGHGMSWQASAWLTSGSHGVPSCTAACDTRRERERKPGPHHSLQSDQALHDVKTQSMGHGCSSQSRVSS
jgi:hypothetical protein